MPADDPFYPPMTYHPIWSVLGWVVLVILYVIVFVVLGVGGAMSGASGY